MNKSVLPWAVPDVLALGLAAAPIPVAIFSEETGEG